MIGSSAPEFRICRGSCGVGKWNSGAHGSAGTNAIRPGHGACALATDCVSRRPAGGPLDGRRDQCREDPPPRRGEARHFRPALGPRGGARARSHAGRPLGGAGVLPLLLRLSDLPAGSIPDGRPAGGVEPMGNLANRHPVALAPRGRWRFERGRRGLQQSGHRGGGLLLEATDREGGGLHQRLSGDGRRFGRRHPVCGGPRRAGHQPQLLRRTSGPPVTVRRRGLRCAHASFGWSGRKRASTSLRGIPG